VALDEGTRVIAVYAEGLADPEGFVAGLRLARERGKPVVILKGGASEASGRAALAHTGRLAGADRTFDAVLQEFAVIRVRSTEEMIDVCGQLASMRPGLGPRNDSVLISTFGGGVGVISTDQCVRAGMQVPVMPPDESASLGRNLSPLSSAANPVDMTPGVMTDPKLRARLPAAIDQMALETRYGAWLFMSSGFGNLAPQLIDMLTRARELADKPILVTWQSMPEGVAELLAERGFYVFHDSARAVRVLELLVRHQQALAQPPRWSGAAPEPGEGAQAWPSASRRETRVLSEPEVAGLLSHAGLPVAPGRFVPAGSDPVACARELGFPVVLKGISPRVTHRAAVGLVALYLDSEAAVGAAVERFKDIERSIGVNLDGFWVQTMMGGQRELLVTALRDPQFGVFVGCGVGGVQTELIDDVVLARAPVDRVHAAAMVRRLRSLKRFPDWLDATQIEAVAGFVSRFSEWAATAPWASFTIEVNPIKVQADRVVAVDGLVVIDQDP
jgi:acetyltransferase